MSIVFQCRCDTQQRMLRWNKLFTFAGQRELKRLSSLRLFLPVGPWKNLEIIFNQLWEKSKDIDGTRKDLRKGNFRFVQMIHRCTTLWRVV